MVQQTTVREAQACYEACAQDKACDFWVWCNQATGCDHNHAFDGRYPFQSCSLIHLHRVRPSRPASVGISPGIGATEAYRQEVERQGEEEILHDWAAGWEHLSGRMRSSITEHLAGSVAQRSCPTVSCICAAAGAPPVSPQTLHGGSKPPQQRVTPHLSGTRLGICPLFNGPEVTLQG